MIHSFAESAPKPWVGMHSFFGDPYILPDGRCIAKTYVGVDRGDRRGRGGRAGEPAGQRPRRAPRDGPAAGGGDFPRRRPAGAHSVAAYGGHRHPSIRLLRDGRRGAARGRLRRVDRSARRDGRRAETAPRNPSRLQHRCCGSLDVAGCLDLPARRRHSGLQRPQPAGTADGDRRRLLSREHRAGRAGDHDRQIAALHRDLVAFPGGVPWAGRR